NREAVALEREPGHLADRRIVLDEQDARPCAALAGAGRAPVSASTLHDHSVQGKPPADSPKHEVVTRPIGEAALILAGGACDAARSRAAAGAMAGQAVAREVDER